MIPSTRVQVPAPVLRLALLAILAARFAASAADLASNFTKGPYLQAPGATSMMLLWESRDALPAEVRFGKGKHLDQVSPVPPPRALTGVSTRYRTNIITGVRTNVATFTVTNVVYVYEATLKDLQPDTSYDYAVDLGSESSAPGTFRTFGSSPAEVRFLVYGDSRSNPKTHTKVAREFLKHKPDFILHTGDLVARGKDYSLWGREFFDPLKGIIDHVPLLPAIGNHEEDGTNYFAYFHLPQPERWYSFDLGPVHVVALDYHFESAAHEQFAFARQDLQASRAPWKLVFLHVPMFNIGGHASTWGHASYLPLFHEAKVDLVIAGHSHLYERFHPVAPRKDKESSPLIYITSGGGGATLYPVYDHPALASRLSTNHYILFEATKEKLRGRAYRPSGRVLDDFELRKDPDGRRIGEATPPYPEEWLKTYFDAAPGLRGVLASLPSKTQPARVTFTLEGLTNAPGPVDLEIGLAPESAKDYEWIGDPLRVTLPAPGAKARMVEAQIRATGHAAITAKPGANVTPMLTFVGRLRSGELDVVARGTRSILAAQPSTNAAAKTDSASTAIALADTFPLDTLKSILLSRADYQPFPTLAQRAAWERIPEKARAALIESGVQTLNRALPALPASLYLDYNRDGNRSRYEGPYFERRRMLHGLVLAECVEAKGRFLDGIANALWTICEESSWCIPAHIAVQKSGVGLPDTSESIVDLFAAQSGVSVAWTLYLMGPELDRVSPQIRRRATAEVQRRILSPVMDRDFGWMGFGSTNRANRPNNWNPWINASVLSAALTLEDNETRRAQLVHRTLRSLDRFLQPYPEDGGCDEGPGYWSRAGGSVLDCLDLLSSGTAGRLDVFSKPLIGEIGRFIHRAHIAGDWFVDIGDCSAKTGIERDLIFRYGRAIRDPQLQSLAASGATMEGLIQSVDSIDLNRALHTLLDLEDILAHNKEQPPLVRDAWLGSDDMQMMIARDREGSTEGFFVAAWGGHNAQSHNHNDVGNCIVFADGQPVMIDLGAPTYTAKTFSSRRYEIPAMQSDYHNLPTINGVQQAAGRSFAAKNVKCQLTEASATLTMDIAEAWPKDAAVASWIRSVRLERGRELRVNETIELKDTHGSTVLRWITPLAPKLDAPGRIALPLAASEGRLHSAVMLEFDPDALQAEFEPVTLDDGRLERTWGKQVTRINLSPKRTTKKAAWELRFTLVR